MTGNTTDIQVPEVMHFENLTGNGTPPTPAANLAQQEGGGEPAAQPAQPAAAPAAGEGAPPEGERRAPERSQRERSMEQIALNRRRAIEKELRYGENMADDARADAGLPPIQHAARAEPAVFDDQPKPAAPPAPAAQPAPVPPVASPQAPPAAPQVPQDRIVVVGGQQYRVSEAQYQQLASVGAVAMEAMNRQQQAEVQQRAQQQPQPQQQPQRPTKILTPEESKQFATRIQYGNEAESARALEEMSNLTAQRILAAQPQLDPRAVVQYATQQALNQMRQETALQNNLLQIGAEYPQIFENESLAQLAALKLHSIRQRDRVSGVQKPDLIAYREACEEVKALLGTPPAAQPQATQAQPEGSPQPVQAASPDSRFERKRAAPSSPRPAQRVASGGEQASRFPSPAEIVAKMKASRGQTY